MTKHRSQDERRAQILSAARECFIRNGYAHTRVDDIAREAGLSKGGVYFHFDSKREIFDALLAQQQERTAALVAEIESGEGGTFDKLTRLGTALLRNFSEGDDHRKFLIVLAEMGIREDDVYGRVAEAHERYVEALARVIERGVEHGEFRDINPRMAALFLKLLVDGTEQGIALGYDFDVFEFMSAGLDFLLRGIAPR